MGLHIFLPQNIQRNLDVGGMFVGTDWSYGHGTLIEVRRDVSMEYSGIYLESIVLLGVARWGDVFPIHVTCCEIWTFAVCLLGMSTAKAMKF